MTRPASLLNARALFAASVLALSLWPAGRLRAADPQPYSVAIEHTNNAALNAAIDGSSELKALRDKVPVGPFALVARARQDEQRFLAALHSYGYYKGSLHITIDGLPLNDPNLAVALRDKPATPPARVVVGVDPGPQFQVAQIALTGTYPPDLQSVIGLKRGAPAVAADVVAARDAMLTRLRNTGYALARVELEPATVFLERDAMAVTYKVDAGPRVDVGPITFTGLDGVNESFARRALPLHQGELFDQAKIEAARGQLVKTPIFNSVIVTPATALDANGQLPITIRTTERPLHAVTAGVSYSTDLGLAVTAGWHHRNLFGNAEQLNVTGAYQFGGNSQLRPGYAFGVQFIKPAFLRADQQLEANLGAKSIDILPYKQTALLESVVVNRQISPEWRAGIGISGEQERITQEGVSTDYRLVGLPLTLRYDSTGDLLNPTHGIRANLQLTPEQALGGHSTTFAIAQLSASTYIDLLGKGRTVLALRGLVGYVAGGSDRSLPPDLRFYAGGSSTVRGYKYQSVGPQFGDGNPIGGTEITAATIELRQRVLKSFGFSLFTDAAQVSAPGGDLAARYHGSNASLAGKYAVGVGAGAEYYTSFGPIRAEFAIPVIRFPNSGKFELYVGLGQSF